MSARVAADLRAVAELLRRDGWTQGTFHDSDTGCYCVQGALDALYAAREVAGEYVADIESAAYIALTKSIGTNRVIDWNDAPGRTADEVIAALEAAADAAEADL